MCWRCLVELVVVVVVSGHCWRGQESSLVQCSAVMVVK